ncbi:MAG: exodeoxyribonuclease III [Myxococcales bacterium]|nr:exodeoxyribonuclease III [Myxococcales bacterium]
MRIATWNVNGIRARLDFVGHWLRERQPDVVGLQELKVADDAFPHEFVAQSGYRALVHGQKSWNGVAVLIREGIVAEVVQQGLPGQDAFGARLLTAAIGSGDDAVSFTTVYVPNGKSVEHDDYPRKLAWLDALNGHLADRHEPARPTVVCGDFNVVPAAIDSWNEERFRGAIFHTDEERKRIARLHELGFVDLFRQRHPDEAQFSWWDYRGGAFHRKHGLRIDFLFGNAPLAERVREVAIDRDWRKKVDGLTPSDHAPVVAELG